MRRTLGFAVAPLIIFFAFFSVANAQSAAQLQAELNALLQQLSALQAQLQISSPVANPVSGTYGKCPSLTRALRQGMSGSDISALQTFLASDSAIYPEGTVSGYFGPLTQAAVERLQRKHGIVSSGNPDTSGYGMVGPATRAVIASVCSGSTTPPPSSQPLVPGMNCSQSGVTMASGSTREFYSVSQASNVSTCTASAQTRQCISGALSGSATYQYANCTVEAPPASCTTDGISVAHNQTVKLFKQKTVLFGQSCAPFGKDRVCSNGIFSDDSAYQYASCAVAAAGSCIVGTTTIAHGQTRDLYSRTSVSYQESCVTYKQARTCTDGILSGSASYQISSCTQIPAQTCTVDGVAVAHSASHTFYTSTIAGCTGSGCVDQEGFVNQETACANISQSRTCTDGTLSGSTQYQYGECAPVGQRWCKLDGVYVQHNTSRTFYTSSSAPYGQSCTQLGQSRTCADGTLQGSASYSRAACTTAAAASCTLDGQAVGHNQSYGFFSRQSVPVGDTCDAYKQTRTCFDGALSGSALFQYRSCSNSTASFLQQANLAAALTALESLLRSALAQLNSWF